MKKLFTALICAIMVLGIGGCGSNNKINTDDITKKFKSNGYNYSLQETKLEIDGDNMSFMTFFDDQGEFAAIVIFYGHDYDSTVLTLTEIENSDKLDLIANNDKCSIEYQDVSKDKYTERDEDCSIYAKKLSDVKNTVERELDNLGLDYYLLHEYIASYIAENK